MNCPECDYCEKYSRNPYSDLFIHVWNRHRNKRDILNIDLDRRSVFECPWCGFFDRAWVDPYQREILRRDHLKECLAYAATCLSGVRIQ